VYILHLSFCFTSLYKSELYFALLNKLDNDICDLALSVKSNGKNFLIWEHHSSTVHVYKVFMSSLWRTYVCEVSKDSLKFSSYLNVAQLDETFFFSVKLERNITLKSLYSTIAQPPYCSCTPKCIGIVKYRQIFSTATNLFARAIASLGLHTKKERGSIKKKAYKQGEIFSCVPECSFGVLAVGLTPWSTQRKKMTQCDFFGLHSCQQKKQRMWGRNEKILALLHCVVDTWKAWLPCIMSFYYSAPLQSCKENLYFHAAVLLHNALKSTLCLLRASITCFHQCTATLWVCHTTERKFPYKKSHPNQTRCECVHAYIVRW